MKKSDPTPACSHCEATPPRRHFIKGALAAMIGAIVTLVPAVAGIAVLLDPIRRKSSANQFLKVARLQDLPEGTPRMFPVVATRTDVWNRIPESKVGAVYLRRQGGVIKAFNVSCPHAGCAVEYKQDAPPAPPKSTLARQDSGFYFCPCHNSSFGLDGSIKNANSPAARGLDELEVQIQGNDILVKYMNYEAGKAEKIPTA